MLRVTNLAVAFLLELAVLFAVGFAGFQLPSPIDWVVGLGAPVLFAVAWGAFAAPRASRPLHGAANAAFQVGWFACGAAAFVVAGAVVPGVVLAVVYAVNSVTLLVTRGHERAAGPADRLAP